MTTTQSSNDSNTALTLYLIAFAIFAVIVASYMIAGLGGLITCFVGLTAVVMVMMAVTARN
ncbi:hypothetical protein C8J30_108118 [Rhodobacter viridis]|uniref:Uncharacterized protein n=1 Tax=Rhodobacter viridis TaxID=1054202 RepID=A0A318TX91_9RHOB|nr:hypothetical protein [Rhodobacter viridis]PYF09542.1 hypothetical protein C8J30_108118 [Rhodobacter viridis]